jgi:cytoskeletal protein CcmA (bactofilin family)
MDAQNSSTVIDGQADIEGILKGRDARILGRFRGEVDVTGQLVLGESSRVDAKIKAGAAEVGGEFRGEIQAKSVTLTEGARVQGRIDADTLAMRDGARLDGEMSVGQGAAGAAPA